MQTVVDLKFLVMLDREIYRLPGLYDVYFNIVNNFELANTPNL